MKYFKYSTITLILFLPLAVSCGSMGKYPNNQTEDPNNQTEDFFNYTLSITSNDEIIIKDAKGNIIEGVTDDKPIRRINKVKTFTIIEGEGTHFLWFNGKKFYLPAAHPPAN